MTPLPPRSARSRRRGGPSASSWRLACAAALLLGPSAAAAPGLLGAYFDGKNPPLAEAGIAPATTRVGAPVD
ncbi:MAG: hypothetical protein ACF8XB_04745, partial [Planctomycetota bacterium JB042]